MMQMVFARCDVATAARQWFVMLLTTFTCVLVTACGDDAVLPPIAQTADAGLGADAVVDDATPDIAVPVDGVELPDTVGGDVVTGADVFSDTFVDASVDGVSGDVGDGGGADPDAGKDDGGESDVEVAQGSDVSDVDTPDVNPIDAASGDVASADDADGSGVDDVDTAIAAEDAEVSTSPDAADDAEIDTEVTADVADVSDVTQLGECAYDGDCTTSLPFCSAQGACVECVFDVQCGTGNQCVAGTCIVGTSCASDVVCKAQDMVCSASVGKCVECVVQADCGSGEVCWHSDCVAAFVPCKSTKDCPGSAVCAGGQCVPCATDADCGAQNWCSGDVCLADLCAPGETQCTKDTAALTCRANGSGWDAGACAAGTVCAEGTCKPTICAPSTSGCDGSVAWTCSANGTTKVSNVCLPGTVCVAGACPSVVCTANTQQCVNGAVETCNATGTETQLDVCPASSGCVDGACVPWTCVPGQASCAGQVAMSCTSAGQLGGLIADCAASAEICLNGTCESPVCTPGATVCAGAGAVNVCGPTGLTWSTQQCVDGFGCLAGQCVPAICAPAAKRCVGSEPQVCAASGTNWVSGQVCDSSTVCVDGDCRPLICLPGSHDCLGGQLRTCSADGTAWSASACPGGSVCDAAACAPVICTPGVKSCSGTQVVLCNALGTAATASTDCATSAQVCSSGACTDPGCISGSVTCFGLTLSICNPDNKTYTTVSCDDGDACTQDGCDSVLSACLHPKVDCSDGNPCTTDTCSTTCQHAPFVGPCDDGSACTTGETCTGGQCIPSSGVSKVGTLAGSGATGWQDGAGSSAWFSTPVDVARGTNGLMLVVEVGGQRIRTIAADGTVATLAGSGVAGALDGPALTARFNGATAIAVGPDGAVWVADTGNNTIRRIAAGDVTTWAGSTAGFADGPGTSAKFTAPRDIAVDASGMIWIADTGNHRVRRMSPAGNTTTVSGTGVAGYVDGAAATAQFSGPCALAPAPDGGMYIGDCGNGRIRKWNVNNTVSTVAGAGVGFQDGAGTSAQFGATLSLAIRGDLLLISDAANNRLRVWSAGTVSSVAGVATAGYADGAPGAAQFSAPRGIATDTSGQVWLADSVNQRIRSVQFASLLCDDANPCTLDTCGATASCKFTALSAGTTCSDGSACTTGDVCGANATCAGVAKSCSDGNACTVDSCLPTDASCEYRVTSAVCDDGTACTALSTCSSGTCVATSSAVSTVAGSLTAGFLDGLGAAARFNGATAIVPGPAGEFWVSDAGNNRIRRVLADGTVTTVAGGTAGYADGAFAIAQFSGPGALTADNGGAAYVVDVGNQRIRKLFGGTVSTLAGSGTVGFLDGPGSTAKFSSPKGLTVTAGGVVLVADTGNHRLRAIASDGTVSTMAGSGAATASDGAAASAGFAGPVGVCADTTTGVIYLADGLSHTVRKFVNGQVTTLAGKSGVFGMVDALGADARFNYPTSCVVDADHVIWVTDAYNYRLRRVTPTGLVSTVAGTMTPPATATDSGAQPLTNGALNVATFTHPGSSWVATPSDIWVADTTAIRRVQLAQPLCDDGDSCTADACQAATGVCTHVALADGVTCSDGTKCTTGETCGGGVCGNNAPGFVAVNCDDGNQCTVDSCSPSTGCGHTTVTGPCDDGKICTSGDTCAAGICTPSVANTCADSNVCTDDTCDAVTGACSYVNNTVPCPADTNGCTIDQCAGGSCAHVTNCDDANGCTSDTCTGVSNGTTTTYSCTHAPNTAGCNDGNLCTSADACSNGACMGVANSCSDGDVCTSDYCNLTSGACTHPSACDDNNPCTDDLCSVAGACSHTNNTALCSDGLQCTQLDQCSAGKCQGIAVTCGSGAACQEPAGCTCGTGYVVLLNDTQVVCAPEYPVWGSQPLTPTLGWFVDVGLGAVSDTHSGLMWQGVMPASVWTQAQASDYCGALNLGGYSDWRLPTRAELETLVDFAATNPAATPNPSGSPSSFVWTAVAASETSDANWAVCLETGGTDIVKNTGTYPARCVRVAAAPTPPVTRFVVDAVAGTVQDKATSLVWQADGSASGAFGWAAAATYCAALGTAGGGWRVPTVVELQSLVDTSRTSPAIPVTAFPGTPFDAGMWTSTKDAADVTRAWTVHFARGVAATASIATTGRVRCVK